MRIHNIVRTYTLVDVSVHLLWMASIEKHELKAVNVRPTYYSEGWLGKLMSYLPTMAICPLLLQSIVPG